MRASPAELDAAATNILVIATFWLNYAAVRGDKDEQAAIRETAEEACARVRNLSIYTLIDVPHISQVHIIYRARLLDLDFRPGEESLEVALLREDEIPWDHIAFRSIAISLRHFFEDRRSGRFQLHTASLAPPPPEWR